MYKYTGKHHLSPEDVTPPPPVAILGSDESPPLGRGPPRPPPWTTTGVGHSPPQTNGGLVRNELIVELDDNSEFTNSQGTVTEEANSQTSC